MSKEIIQNLKVICLMEMHHSPWTDTSRFQKGEKSKLVTLMKSKLDTLTTEQITAEFNTIVCEKLFHNGAAIEKYPVCS